MYTDNDQKQISRHFYTFIDYLSKVEDKWQYLSSISGIRSLDGMLLSENRWPYSGKTHLSWQRTQTSSQTLTVWKVKMQGSVFKMHLKWIIWWSSNSCPPKETLFPKFKHAKQELHKMKISRFALFSCAILISWYGCADITAPNHVHIVQACINKQPYYAI